MEKNEKGFTVVEIILAVVVVGLLVGLGWYVWQANMPPATMKTGTSTAPQTTEQEPADTTRPKSYTRYGLTFSYPQDWALAAADNMQSRSTVLTSPDFTDTGTQGQRVTIDEAVFLENNLTADNFRTKHLDANPNSYRDYKDLTIDGKKAVQYRQGDSLTTVFFLADGKKVVFVLDTFPDRNATSPVYTQVVESVVLQ